MYDDNDLIPAGYEDNLLRTNLRDAHTKNMDPFELLGVSNEDKMTFFLLKWVFNAIKQEGGEPSSVDVEQASAFIVTKADLIKQLQQNQEIMSALDITNAK